MSSQYSLEDHDDQIQINLAWEHVALRLRESLDDKSFGRFIKPLKARALGDGRVQIVASSAFVADWVRNRYLSRLSEMFSDEIGTECAVEVAVDTAPRPPLNPLNATVAPRATVTPEPSKFTPAERLTFERFVVGQSNRMAWAGASDVAANPGKTYNPLFIYGPSGLGKTHLLHAIANRVLERNPRFNLAFITAQEFAENFVRAIQQQRVDAFRKQHRNVHLWLVDDIQLIMGRDKTLEEVFHTFNLLHGSNRQIVLTSDRSPKELLMDERLRTRFEAGLVVDIQMPDTETRSAILLARAEQQNIPLSMEVALYLAENVPGNVRVLEGVLTMIAVHASVDNRAISLELASELVGRYYRTTQVPTPGADQIVSAVSRHFRISPSELRGPSRRAPVAHARHVAIYIVRELTRDSWKHIGSVFGDRDHSTIMHAHSRIRSLVDDDRELLSAIQGLMRDLNPN